MPSRELLGLHRTAKPPPGTDILIYSHHKIHINPHKRRHSASSQASKCNMVEKTMGFKMIGCYHWTGSTGQMFPGHEAKKHNSCLKQNIFHWLQKCMRLQGHTQACSTFYMGAKNRFSGLQNKLLPHWVISPGFNLIVYQKVTLILFLASWPVDSRESSVSIHMVYVIDIHHHTWILTLVLEIQI